MPRMQIRTIDSPIGPLTLAVDADCGALTAIRFGDEGGRDDSPALVLAQRQLEEYFRGERTRFDLPLQPKGTPFQLAVWRALTEIPYGTTASYGDIARAIGRPKAFRAVGMANHCNPIPIIVPCHRVIGSDGGLTGYAGGLEIKRALLELEQKWKR